MITSPRLHKTSTYQVQVGYISGTHRVHIRYTYGTYQVHSGYTSGTWVDWLGQYCLRRRRNLPRGFILVYVCTNVRCVMYVPSGCCQRPDVDVSKNTTLQKKIICLAENRWKREYRCLRSMICKIFCQRVVNFRTSPGVRCRQTLCRRNHTPRWCCAKVFA